MNGLEDMVRRLNAKLEQQDTSRVLVTSDGSGQKKFCMSRLRKLERTSQDLRESQSQRR